MYERKEVTTVKVLMPNDGQFKVNTLANLVPMASPAEQAVLTASIKEQGQREPIVLWRGEIVDGRCRQKACIDLGIPILYKEIDSENSKEDVGILVKALNTRRNLTHTQKVMVASKESMRSDSSVKKQAKAWGVSEVLVKNARWIWNIYPDIAQELFDGKGIAIDDKVTNKVTPIYSYLRKKSETIVMDMPETHGWVDESAIRTQAGKEWYYTQLGAIKEHGDVYLNQLLVDMANKQFLKIG